MLITMETGITGYHLHQASYHAKHFLFFFISSHTVQTFNSCTSRPDVCQCLVVQTPMDNMSKINKPSTSMAHVNFKPKLLSVVRSSMHPYSGNWVSMGHAVVYYVRAAHAFSAGIKCRHCRIQLIIFPHIFQHFFDLVCFCCIYCFVLGNLPGN